MHSSKQGITMGRKNKNHSGRFKHIHAYFRHVHELKHIQNPMKHLRCSVLQKLLTAVVVLAN